MTANENVGEIPVEAVLRLLTALDPYLLEPGGPDGVPADEYNVEAAPIAGLLSENGSITATHVDGVWLEWFDEPLTRVVGDERMRELVTALTGLVARE